MTPFSIGWSREIRHHNNEDAVNTTYHTFLSIFCKVPVKVL